ncbi:MAG: acyltransferase [Prevotella sp.]|nr:acyltransferase [Prevotella sp.]
MISKIESQALRGIAILGIVLHNYCHFLGEAVKENEYKFDPSRPAQFWDKLTSLDSDLFIHIFSFLGHYGVPIFLFISGYGLVKKYEAQSTQPATTFIWQHFVKLFKLMIWGYVLFVAVWFLRHNDGMTVYSWDRVLAQLTMTVNFVYFEPNQIIKPGPYWYFGLMIQLYILYILVLHRWRGKALLLGIVLAAAVVQYALGLLDDARWLNYVRYNFIGGVLPFCAGIWLSRRERNRTDYGMTTLRNTQILIISLVAVLAGSFMLETWLWVPLFIVSGAVATVKLLPEKINKAFVWVGVISAELFVMHPLMRELVLSHYRRIDVYFGIFIYLLASIALAAIYHELRTSK